MSAYQQGAQNAVEGEEEEELDTCEGAWMPEEGEEGLLELLSLLRGKAGNPWAIAEPRLLIEIPLAARPDKELGNNYVGVDGTVLDLRQQRILVGMKAVRKQMVSRGGSGWVGATQASDYLNALYPTRDTFVIVTHEDHSHWARRNYPTDARGGFLCEVGDETEASLPGVPFVLNPFARAHVPRALALRIGEDPGAIVAELTEKQFFVAMEHCSQAGSGELSQEQFDAVMSLQANLIPEGMESRLVPQLDWSIGPLYLWSFGQRAAFVLTAVLFGYGYFRGAALGNSHSKIRGALWALGGFVFGAAGAALGTASALVNPRSLGGLPYCVPTSAIASSAVACTVLHASPRQRAVALFLHQVATFLVCRILATPDVLDPSSYEDDTENPVYPEYQNGELVYPTYQNKNQEWR
eukprot:Hpha_TRINITY_DN14225_c0_g1::TRINITY_DN14225_c0_g1_i1::g.22816::m.22816